MSEAILSTKIATDLDHLLPPKEGEADPVVLSRIDADHRAVKFGGEDIRACWEELTKLDPKYNPIYGELDDLAVADVGFYMEIGTVPAEVSDALGDYVHEFGGGYLLVMRNMDEKASKAAASFIKIVSSRYAPQGQETFASEEDVKNRGGSLALKKIYSQVTSVFESKNADNEIFADLKARVTHETSGWGTLADLALPAAMAMGAVALTASAPVSVPIILGALAAAGGTALSQVYFQKRNLSELQYSWIVVNGISGLFSAGGTGAAALARSGRAVSLLERMSGGWKSLVGLGQKAVRPVGTFIERIGQASSVQGAAQTTVGRLAVRGAKWTGNKVYSVGKKVVNSPFARTVAEEGIMGKLTLGIWPMLKYGVWPVLKALLKGVGWVLGKAGEGIGRVARAAATKWPKLQGSVDASSVAIASFKEKAPGILKPVGKMVIDDLALVGIQKGIAFGTDETGRPVGESVPFDTDHVPQLLAQLYDQEMWQTVGLSAVEVLARKPLAQHAHLKHFYNKADDSNATPSILRRAISNYILPSYERNLGNLEKEVSLLEADEGITKEAIQKLRSTLDLLVQEVSENNSYVRKAQGRYYLHTHLIDQWDDLIERIRKLNERIGTLHANLNPWIS